MKPLFLLPAILSCAGTACGQQAQTSSAPRSQVRFEALTHFGQHKDFRIQSIVSYLPAKDYTSHCSGAICDDLPLARYDYVLQLTQPGGMKITGTFIAVHPQELVVDDAGENGSVYDVGNNFLIGHIHGLAKNTLLAWVRLTPVFAGDVTNALISPSGEFRVSCPLLGRYEIYVFQGDQILCRSPVDWLPRHAAPTVDIDLTGGDCTVRTR